MKKIIFFLWISALYNVPAASDTPSPRGEKEAVDGDLPDKFPNVSSNVQLILNSIQEAERLFSSDSGQNNKELSVEYLNDLGNRLASALDFCIECKEDLYFAKKIPEVQKFRAKIQDLLRESSKADLE